MKKLKPNYMEWVYITVGVFLIIFLVGVFTSCTVVKTDYSAKAVKEGTVYYYLPKSLIRIRSTAKIAVSYNNDSTLLTGTVVEQTFTITPEIVADTRDLLALIYTSNAMMTDEIKYGVNNKGLLETVNITTDDRTSEIIKRLAEAPQIIFGKDDITKDAGDNIIKMKEVSSEFMVDASTLNSTDSIIIWNILMLNEFGKEEAPINVSANFSINTPNVAPDAARAATLSPVQALMGNNTTETNGILTRPVKTIQVNFIVQLGAQPSMSSWFTTITDDGKLFLIPVRRTAFVKRVNKISVVDGIVTSNEIINPSAVEGFISIPINVAKTIVSIPGQLVTFRYDNTKKLNMLEDEKLKLEKSILESQKFELTRGQDLEKVKLDIEKATLSNEFALRILKLELEKNLVEAEKNRLNVEKELENLKKEIEELKKKI